MPVMQCFKIFWKHTDITYYTCRNNQINWQCHTGSRYKQIFFLQYMLRRYLLFVPALFINTFGVAFVTKALLGTSPITSITYVLSLFTLLTMGEWTIIVNILFVLLELPFMNKKWLRNDLRLYLSQIPVSIVLHCISYIVGGIAL